MMKCTLATFFFILKCSCSLFPQTPSYKHLTTDDGLPSSEIYQVIQDSKGYIWFATDRGVCRYDGYKFETFSTENGLADNTIFKVYEDDKGRVWFAGVSCKLSYFLNNKIHSYAYNDPLIKQLGGSPVITSLYVDKGDTLHLGFASKGYYKIGPGGKIISVASGMHADAAGGSFLYEKNGRIIVFSKPAKTENDGTYRLHLLSKKADTTFVVHISDPRHRTDQNILSLARKNGEILMAKGNILFKITTKKEIAIQIFDNSILSLFEDYLNRTWISFANNGVMCFDETGMKTGKPLFHFLNIKTITSFLMDREGGVWMTTHEDGVFYLPSLNFNTYNTESGLCNNTITAICGDGRTRIYASAFSGCLNIFDEQTGYMNSLQTPDTDVFVSQVKAIFYDKRTEKLWVGNTEKIKVYNKSLQTIESYPYFVRDISEGADSAIVGIASKGIINIVNKKVILYPWDTTLVLKPEAIFRMKDNSLLIGNASGLYSFRGGKYSFLGKKNPLLSTRIVDIGTASNGDTWMASREAGLIRMNKDTVQNITVKDGLLTNLLTCLYVDKNVVWAGSSKGVNKIWSENGKIKIACVTHRAGLVSDEVNKIYVQQGKVWVATKKGITVFNSDDVLVNVLPPPVYITGLKLNSRDTVLNDGVALKHTENDVQFSFVGLNYKNAGATNYKFKLAGAENKWRYTRQTQVFYPSLPSGKYRFIVTASNEDGYWNNAPASFSFTIHKAYWEEWWFSGGIALAVISASLYFVRAKVKRLNERHQWTEDLNKYQMQALRAQMNPHFIFNSLNSIQHFLLKNDPESSQKFLSRFSRLMRQVFDNSLRDFITINEELSALEKYMELECIRFNGKFSYEIKIDPAIDTNKYKMPGLLIQPYIENAIWHGLMQKKDGDGKISLELKLHEKIIYCIIEDNGIGRKHAEEIKSREENTSLHKSRGSAITAKRLKLLSKIKESNMKIEFKDMYDETGKAKGTRVFISFPEQV